MLSGHKRCAECGDWLHLEFGSGGPGGELSRGWVCVGCNKSTTEHWVAGKPCGKVLISGPGRAGTTFLIKLLSLLGLETFFPPSVIAAGGPVVPGTRGSGFEVLPEPSVLWQHVSQRVVKGSYWCFGLREFLENGWITVDHVLIPVRDLQQVAESRLDVGLHWCIPKDGATVAAQRQVCAWALGEIISTCVAFNIPYTIMHFPRLVYDPHYCWAQLLVVLPELDGEWEDFKKIFDKLSDPAGIKFGGGTDEVKEAV